MALTSSQLVYLVVVVAAFGLLVTERLRNDVVAVLIVLALAAGRVLGPRGALSGFSSELAIVVATRAPSACSCPRWPLLSAFAHHVTTTAVMLPVTLKLSRERNIPASCLLMPLSSRPRWARASPSSARAPS